MRCYDKGSRFFSSSFVVFVLKRNEPQLPWRLGMAVTKKTGNAVWRNRVRRLIREVFRLEQEQISAGHDIVVVPKKGTNPRELSFSSLQGELLPILKKIAEKASRAQ